MNVAIFKHGFLQKTELFVLEQGLNISRKHNSFFVGTKRIESGLDFEEEEVFFHVNSGSVKLLKFILLGKSKELESFLVEKKIDIVHVHFAIDASLILNVCKKLSIPLITTLHGYDVETSIFKAKPKFLSHLLFFFRKRKLMDYCKKFVCVSEGVKSKAIINGFPHEKLEVNYLGVDITKFNSCHQDGSIEFDICFVGRLVEKKGCEYLIKAIKSLAFTYPNIRVAIVGDGPLRGELENKSRDLLGVNIFFLGKKDNLSVIKTMKNSKIFCLPSCTASNGDAEGLPITILEAMALGKPIVSTNHSGIPEAVESNVNGYLCDERCSKQLEQALEKLISNNNLVQKMGNESREIILDRFDAAELVLELSDIYEKTSL